MDNNEIPPYDIPFDNDGDENLKGNMPQEQGSDAGYSNDKIVYDTPIQDEVLPQDDFSGNDLSGNDFMTPDDYMVSGDVPIQGDVPVPDDFSAQGEFSDEQLPSEEQIPEMNQGIQPPPPKGKKGGILGFLVIIVLLFVVLCGALAFMYSDSSGDSKTADNPPQKDLNVMDLNNNEAEDLNGLAEEGAEAQTDSEMADLANENSENTGVEITRNRNSANKNEQGTAPASNKEEKFPPLPGAKNRDGLGDGNGLDMRVSYSGGGTGRLDPFNPKIGSNDDMFEVIVPPVDPTPDLETQMLMSLRISGIMYTPESPSAIINIAGEDQLVRKGDVFNGFSVVNITKDKVTVKAGANVYTASVGEILKIEQVGVNSIPNLNKKFAGPYSKGKDKIIEINMID